MGPDLKRRNEDQKEEEREGGELGVGFLVSPISVDGRRLREEQAKCPAREAREADVGSYKDVQC